MGFHILDDTLNCPEQETFKTVRLLQAISALGENSPRVSLHINSMKGCKIYVTYIDVYTDTYIRQVSNHTFNG